MVVPPPSVGGRPPGPSTAHAGGRDTVHLAPRGRGSSADDAPTRRGGRWSIQESGPPALVRGPSGEDRGRTRPEGRAGRPEVVAVAERLVVVGVDCSRASDTTLDWALESAARRGSRVDVVH